MAKLPREIVSQSRVIAKGKRIRDVQRLVHQYGGRISKWTKKSSSPIQVGQNLIEYHWYEHPGLGMFEIKRKIVE